MADGQRVYTVYCATSPSGRRYVGQTTKTARRRWQNHVSNANIGRGNTPLVNAIRKYGADAFAVVELACAYDQRTADVLERSLIDALDALAPSGYNVAQGGAKCARHPESVRAKLRAAWARNPARKQALAAQGRANAGRTHSDETREKMRLAHTGVKSSVEATAKRTAWWTPERRAAKAEENRRRRARG